VAWLDATRDKKERRGVQELVAEGEGNGDNIAQPCGENSFWSGRCFGRLIDYNFMFVEKRIRKVAIFIVKEKVVYGSYGILFELNKDLLFIIII